MDEATLKKVLMDIQGVARGLKGDGLKAKYAPAAEPEEEGAMDEAPPAEGAELPAELELGGDGMPPPEGEDGAQPMGGLDEEKIAQLMAMLGAAK